jgi:hypothetical protein
MLNLKKKNKDDDSKDAENVENEEKVEKEENGEKEKVELPVKETAKEVSRREIDTLKSDVDNLSSELNSAVTSLKKSVVDIRSAVSEIENPFNLLRAIQGEKEMKDLNHKRLPNGVKSLILSGPNEETAETEEPENEALLDEPPKVENEPKPEEALVEEPPKTQTTPQPEKVLSTQPKRQSPKGTSDFLDWVWAHIDSGLTANDIFSLAKSYEFLGYLPEKFGEGIYHLALAAEKMKSGGFNKKHLLLNMYQAASISGIQIELPDVNKLISIVEDETKSSTRTVTSGNK